MNRLLQLACVFLLFECMFLFVCIAGSSEFRVCMSLEASVSDGRLCTMEGQWLARTPNVRALNAPIHICIQVCVCVYMYQVNILVIRLYCRVYAMDEALIACTCWHEASIRKHITISLKIFCAPTLIFFFLHIIPVLILSFSRVGYMETHAHGYPMQTCAYNVIKIWIFNVN